MVNSKRPQTSYGGISARQRSLQKSLRQKSSKVGHEKQEELFPMPPKGDLDQIYSGGVSNINGNFDLEFKNKLVKLIQK
jgi:hypothetical protein